MIKAICFDLDGVYFPSEGKKSFEKSLIDLTFSTDKVIHALYKSDEMLQFVKGEISEDQFWDYMRNYLEISLSNEELINLWVKDYSVNSEVAGLIKTLRDTGYKSCTCSNNNPSRVRALNAKFGFLHDFDVAVFSYEVGFVKPDKKIFQELILRVGCDASEIVYSDDNPERLKGAEELGIQTFVYTNFNKFKQELYNLGVNLGV